MATSTGAPWDTACLPMVIAVHIVSTVSMPLPFTPTHCHGSGLYSGCAASTPNDSMIFGVDSIASLAIRYCAVSNALSVGGMVKFDSAMVDLSDGLFEILMIRYPQNLADLQKILHDLATHHYDSDLILYFKAEEVTVESDEPIAWTVDGEMGGTTAEARVRNCHRAIRILKPEEEEHA